MNIQALSTIPMLYLLAVLAALQLADWYTTRTILSRGGRELNPVIRKLMGWIGVDAALCAKGAALVAAAHFFFDRIDMFILFAIYLVVVGNNVRVMRSLRSVR